MRRFISVHGLHGKDILYLEIAFPLKNVIIGAEPNDRILIGYAQFTLARNEFFRELQTHGNQAAYFLPA